ncbi:diguanylate cyclase [Vreelandella aquamarina]|uniref:diguanylate cyclase n=1 Tax=Vreelandella aquamarina TaxID=77097 RepID=UPI00384E6B8E
MRVVNGEPNSLEHKLALLKKTYQQNLQTELASLCQELSKLQKCIRSQLMASAGVVNTVVDTSPRAMLEDVYRRLHKLAGSAGTFGFDAIGHQARLLEGVLKRCLEEGKAAIDLQLIDVVSSQLQSMQVELVPSLKKVSPVKAKPGKGSMAANIWLIEEDAELGQLILEQLTNFSYAVRLFSSVPAACKEINKETPDIVIVDVKTSVEHCSPLHALSCPLLFISNSDTFDARMQAAQLNAQGYFLKPLNIPQLVNRLEQLLQEYKSPPARILVVDDDQQLAAYYQLVLESAGMEVRILDKPRYIIEQLNSFRPDLLLMDVHMPDYDGPDLASVVRQYDEWSSLPIVFLSAEMDLSKQVDALSHGADDFLTKPILAAQLIASIRVRVARSRTLSALLNRDSLTGLLKHASIKSAAMNEVTRGFRQGYPVVVAMIDIDNFKSINDTYGHAVGDVVIASVATLLRQRLRQTDMIGRYGGEEFLLVMPHCCAEDGRRRLEDIREYFSRLRFNHGDQEFACTLSAGMVCSADAIHDDQDRLLVVADEALYRAKRRGRNQVCH